MKETGTSLSSLHVFSDTHTHLSKPSSRLIAPLFLKASAVLMVRFWTASWQINTTRCSSGSTQRLKRWRTPRKGLRDSEMKPRSCWETPRTSCRDSQVCLCWCLSGECSEKGNRCNCAAAPVLRRSEQLKYFNLEWWLRLMKTHYRHNPLLFSPALKHVSWNMVKMAKIQSWTKLKSIIALLQLFFCIMLLKTDQ